MIVVKVQDTNLQTDADLLKKFSSSGSQAAFATLVEMINMRLRPGAEPKA